jgi:hypothetical protein
LQAIRDDKENNKFILAYFGSKSNPLFEKTFLDFSKDEER